MTAKVLGRVSGATAAAAILLIGAAASASAGENSGSSWASNGDGYVSFIANGDDFHVADTKCDGDTVWGQVSYYKSGYGWNFRTIHNTSGCGTIDTKHPWSDIPEGADVYVRACGTVDSGYSNSGTGQFSTGHDCGDTVSGVA
ncbi:hypothetical protein [Streptomyces pseudovenezuelae]